MKFFVLAKFKILINKLQRVAARTHDNLACTGQIVVTVFIPCIISVCIRGIFICILRDQRISDVQSTICNQSTVHIQFSTTNIGLSKTTITNASGHIDRITINAKAVCISHFLCAIATVVVIVQTVKNHASRFTDCQCTGRGDIYHCSRQELKIMVDRTLTGNSELISRAQRNNIICCINGRGIWYTGKRNTQIKLKLTGFCYSPLVNLKNNLIRCRIIILCHSSRFK